MATPRLAVVLLEGADGRPLEVEVLSGARRLEPRPAVIACHASQEPTGGAGFRRARERLAVAGFAVLSFAASASAARDAANLAAVVEYAVAEGSPWVGLLGQGAGVGAVGSFAAQDARVQAVALWGEAESAGAVPARTAAQSMVIKGGDPVEKTVAFFSAALP